MKSHVKHYIFLITSSFLLLVSYSNCSYNGKNPNAGFEPIKVENTQLQQKNSQ